MPLPPLVTRGFSRSRSEGPTVELTFTDSPAGHAVSLAERGVVVASVPEPVDCHFLDGSGHTGGYATVEVPSASTWRGTATWRHGGVDLVLVDQWSVVEDGTTVALRRRITASGGAGAVVGLQLRLAIRVNVPVEDKVRFFVPAVMYAPDQWAAERLYSYADHRLAYPLASVFSPANGAVLTFARDRVARFDSTPSRNLGESRFLHDTDVGSVGFATTDPRAPTLHAAWPYREADTSGMLDAAGTPALAYFPLLGNGAEASVSYEIRRAPAEDYVGAVRGAVRHVVDSPQLRPTPTPVPLAETIRLRLDSAARTYRRWENGGAGFVLNFDPERGYASAARAFGASFTDHEMSGSRDILEYGFTGRQLNLAYLLAARDPQGWRDRGAAVVASYVERMTTDSGWVYTLWHAGRGRPLFACGDPSGPVMHYLGRSDVAGTYTRMMAEAGSDLLLNVGLHRSLGTAPVEWLDAGVRLADFFVRHQEDDGAWFRAYAPDGAPISGSAWFGDTPAAAKTATGTVIPFLLDVAGALGPDGERYRSAAHRAGAYVMEHHVATDDYRGGTLDNPNVVDKEGAFIAMRGLLALYDDTGDGAFLRGAHRAASLAATWHSLWEVPNVPGTRVGEAGVRSVGWGGINSIWGAGVTDIYSLFFIADLHRLGVLVGDHTLCRAAELIACSSVQLLSVPGNLHGLADTGMQPEGIAFCSQGMDDGLIRKGDIWGGLGWPYTAGTFGLQRYLDVLAATPADARHPQTVPIGETKPTERQGVHRCGDPES